MESYESDSDSHILDFFRGIQGPIHLFNTGKYCDNTWKMCSPADLKFWSFEAILNRISVNINFTSQFQGNFPTPSFEIDQKCFKAYKYGDNTCKYYTCRWTHFSSIASILVSIEVILTSIEPILEKCVHLQVLSQTE